LLICQERRKIPRCSVAAANVTFTAGASASAIEVLTGASLADRERRWRIVRRGKND